MIDVRHGDSRDVLKTMADASIDSCVTDPPYALVSIVKRFGKSKPENEKFAATNPTSAYRSASAGFMGQKWDTGETAFDPEFWAEVYRVLKPGAHLLAFSGTRTYHRMVCAIEDAGFEVRDQIGWLYGSGFPKSHNLTGKAEGFDGWGTALKPAWEPVVVARKPLIGTVAANVMQHGTGALNIDGCRVAHFEECKPMAAQDGGDKVFGQGGRKVETTDLKANGRWPANLVHDGSPEVLACFPETGISAGGRIGNAGGGNVKNLPTGEFLSGDPGFGDRGSAARFFYTAKADAGDRLGSKHPTVKPVDLMRWLCRLVTPQGGLVLDPFAGSGTAGMACMAEGFDAILIEREANFVEDIKRRIAHVSGQDAPLFAGQSEAVTPPAGEGRFTESSRTKNRPGRIEEVA